MKRVIVAWGSDALPPLLAGLKDKKDQVVYGILDLLHRIGRGHPRVLAAVKSLSEDSSRSERLRQLAGAILDDRVGRAEK